MKDFDDARTATEEMFDNNEQLSLDDTVQAQEAEEQPVEAEQNSATETTEAVVEQPTAENETLDNAVNTAETAAMVAQEKDMQLQQALPLILK